jgi:7-cyano-7-deazaguanine synthase in queuosine biosynthesis
VLPLVVAGGVPLAGMRRNSHKPDREEKRSFLPARRGILITSCMAVAADYDCRRCAHEKYRGDDQRFPGAGDELIRAADERSK